MKQDIQLLNTLVDFYGHCGDIDSARQLFEYAHIRDNVSEVTIACWMSALINCGMHNEALAVYDDIEHMNVSCDRVCHMLAIKAVSFLRDKEKGCAIHRAVQHQLMDAPLRHALMEFYGIVGDVPAAQQIFEATVPMSIACIATMMQVYETNGMPDECLRLFHDIHSFSNHELKPNVMCYRSALQACTHDGSKASTFEIGQKLHRKLEADVDGNAWMLREDVIRIALIDLYGAQQMFDHCLRVFGDPFLNQNVSVWNALLNAYATNGKLDECKELLECMCNEFQVVPDDTTFALLDAACGSQPEFYKQLKQEISDKRFLLMKTSIS